MSYETKRSGEEFVKEIQHYVFVTYGLTVSNRSLKTVKQHYLLVLHENERLAKLNVLKVQAEELGYSLVKKQREKGEVLG